MLSVLYSFYGVASPTGDLYPKSIVATATWSKEAELKVVKFLEDIKSSKNAEAMNMVAEVVSKFREEQNQTYCRTKLEKMFG